MPRAHSFSELLSILLKAIAARHGDQARVLLVEDPQVFHRVFYKVDRKYKRHFPELGELHFITAGAYPYSPELTEALDSLQMSGAISRENPSFERFSPKRYHDTAPVQEARQRKLVGGDAAKQKLFDDLVEYLDQELNA
jgi:hypothetical protein